MATPTNTYVDRTFPTAPSAGFDAVHGIVTIEQSDDSVGYFYATQYGFKNAAAGAGGYMGLQTRLSTQGGIHHGAIFSIFGATNASTRTGADVVHSTENGADFWSVRCWYPWVTGNTYNVYMDTWTADVYRCMVDCTTTGAISSTEVGFISVPSTWDGFDNWAVQWTEMYSGFTTCAAIPVTKSLWPKPYVHAHATSSNPHLQTGTTCTNSGIILTDTDQTYREVIGATS